MNNRPLLTAIQLKNEGRNQLLGVNFNFNVSFIGSFGAKNGTRS